MKTFVFDAINEYKRFSEKLDTMTVICNRPWNVYNEDSVKETYIFEKDGSLIISRNGEVTNSTWKYVTANRSIVIQTSDKTYMLRPMFLDEALLVLNLDGTSQFSFMVDENNKKGLQLHSQQDLLSYFKQKQLESQPKEEPKQEPKEPVQNVTYDLDEGKATKITIYIITVAVILFIVGLAGNNAGCSKSQYNALDTLAVDSTVVDTTVSEDIYADQF